MYPSLSLDILTAVSTYSHLYTLRVVLYLWFDWIPSRLKQLNNTPSCNTFLVVAYYVATLIEAICLGAQLAITPQSIYLITHFITATVLKIVISNYTNYMNAGNQLYK